MSNNSSQNNFFDTKVMGQPAGLFVLFFTEMWERFSYYGMRALLVMFFTASLLDNGWGWSEGNAFAIFGTYTSLVYISTMLGGYFADNIIGYRWAVVIGALLMTLGHGCMAAETPFFIYLGLLFLVFGSGFFKPNMTSIISEMYKDFPEKKDGAYTIFYMGVNAGAFFGIMLCGYLGEKIGWSWGFGVAGIFMLFGLLQFWFARGIFGDVGLVPKKKMEAHVIDDATPDDIEDIEKRVSLEAKNPFTTGQLILIFTSALLGLLWIFNDPLSKITEGAINILPSQLLGMNGANFTIITALILFIIVLGIRLPKYSKVVRERMYAIIFFAFITMFFWALFEQAPGTLTKFAQNYTQRILSGSSGVIFKIADALITIIPLSIISYVLFLLFRKTFQKYALSNIFLAISFIIIWGIAIWKVQNDYKASSYVVSYFDNNGEEQSADVVSSIDYKPGQEIPIINNETISLYDPNAKDNKEKEIKNNVLYSKGEKIGEAFTGKISKIFKEEKKGAGILITKANIEFTNAKGDQVSKVVKIPKDSLEKYPAGTETSISITNQVKYNSSNAKLATVGKVKTKKNGVEIPATWFNILNSLFIIALAPLFSRWWESKRNPTANGKYAIGMLLLGIGMAIVAIAAHGIAPGAKSANITLFVLAFVYFFHTMGELCVSPVALSYVSKLVPGRMIAVMFGIWYLAVAIGMKLAGIFGEMSGGIADEKGISYFFWILTAVAIVLSLLAWVTTPVVKKWMHGVK